MQGSACKQLLFICVILSLLCTVAMSIWNAAEAASVVVVLYDVQKRSAEGGLSDPSVPSGDAVCCRLYAFEAVGLLLGQEELPADEQQAYIAALLQPLIHQVRLQLLVYDNSYERTI